MVMLPARISLLRRRRVGNWFAAKYVSLDCPWSECVAWNASHMNIGTPLPPLCADCASSDACCSMRSIAVSRKSSVSYSPWYLSPTCSDDCAAEALPTSHPSTRSYTLMSRRTPVLLRTWKVPASWVAYVLQRHGKIRIVLDLEILEADLVHPFTREQRGARGTARRLSVQPGKLNAGLRERVHVRRDGVRVIRAVAALIFSRARQVFALVPQIVPACIIERNEEDVRRVRRRILRADVIRGRLKGFSHGRVEGRAARAPHRCGADHRERCGL